ncbi:hypothetical protein VTJ49DRAFT_1771 [Mycothermus thermophilus]|uniref:Uncharacterized protein n=1 Tax=Humicola insolens TaxID=85995 RepID=A0ABR3VR44_HUMIN
MPINWASLYSLLAPPAALRDVFTLSLSQPAVDDDQTKSTTKPTDNTNLPMPPTSSRAATTTTTNGHDIYPPNSTTTTHRSPSMSSSTSSASTSTTSLPTDDQPVAPRRSATHVVALDPLSRDFPKPANEPSLEELLARKPLRHSLQHVLRNPREPAVQRKEEEEAAERQRKFEEAKKKLLEAKEELDRGRKI